MKKFKGWRSVFGFTFKQSVSGKGYKIGTAIVSLLIIAAFVAVNLFLAHDNEEKGKNKVNDPSPIEIVYVQDNSGLIATSLEDFIKSSTPEVFGHIQFVMDPDKDRSEIIKKITNTPTSLAVFIDAKDGGYNLEVVVPEGSTIKKKQANALLKEMTSAFNTNKLLQSGLSNEQLNLALNPIATSYLDIGEDENVFVTIIKVIAPMAFGFILYFMLLQYGQTVSKSISTEKTSKLMETLLTSIHPYALITGKVLGVVSTALLQFGIWIISVIIGLYGGNVIAQSFFPGYENSVVTIITFLKENIGETALSLPAILVAIVFLFLGFIFYCVIAGLSGCLVSKPEEVAQTQAIFQLPVIISWVVSYFAPLYGKEEIIDVARYIPFTSPFIVPVELITGTLRLGQGLISFAILLVFSLLVIMFSARIYKGLILYTGQKISPKVIGNVLRNKQ